MISEAELTRFLEKKLCEIGRVLMIYYDCCALHGSTCKAGENMCCVNSLYGKGLCPFWQHNACQYENCGCVLWLCETAVKTTDPKCIEALKALEKLAELYHLVGPPLIGEPYVGADRQPK